MDTACYPNEVIKIYNKMANISNSEDKTWKCIHCGSINKGQHCIWCWAKKNESKTN